MKPRYECNECGRDEITARREGCGEAAPRYCDVPYASGVERVRINACPMDFRPRSLRHFLYHKLGILLP